MPPKKKSRTVGAVDPANMTAAEGIGHEILTQYADLAPSVNRILSSPLSEPGRLHAITLFRDSLSQPGDPMRNPAAAVEAGLAFDDTAR